MRRFSPATVISVVALFIAMSGTAVAATGGNFILGKSNTATAESSLTNMRGSALKLTSKAASPPLEVSNSIQVPNLNASELGGMPANAFLGANGTAANSNELGGTPASGFVQGSGNVGDGRVSLLPGGNEEVVGAPGSAIVGYCTGAGDSLYLFNESQNSISATWWNPDGSAHATLPAGAAAVDLDGTTPTTAVIMVQVDTGTSIATYTVTETESSGVCSFTGQVLNSNG